MNKNLKNVQLSDVEETGLLTLYAKAMESRSSNPILKDVKAEEIAQRLDSLLEQKDSAMARQLRERKIESRLVVHIALRSRKYDEYAVEFLQSCPDSVVVNIGCGMDTRFFRIDNGCCRFFDLDLPDVISFKKKLVNETERYRMIGQSVLDLGWMDAVKKPGKPVIFLAEGVFMYLPKNGVRKLVREMAENFRDSELVCELTNRIWVDGFWGKMASLKMQRRTKMGADASFQFGVSSAEDLEAWHDGIELAEKWFYMDSNHPKLGWMSVFKNVQLMREAQFTARYKLNSR